MRLGGLGFAPPQEFLGNDYNDNFDDNARASMEKLTIIIDRLTD